MPVCIYVYIREGLNTMIPYILLICMCFCSTLMWYVSVCLYLGKHNLGTFKIIVPDMMTFHKLIQPGN